MKMQESKIDSIKIIDAVKQDIPFEIINSIQLPDPINIVDATERGFDYGLWISVLIAIISTGILIWNQIKKSKVYGKIISKTFSQSANYTYKKTSNDTDTISGQQYILKLSISCLRKNLNYKDVIVHVHYGKEKLIGDIYWTKYSNLSFLNDDGSTISKKMITPSNEFLTFNNVLEKDKTTFFHLNFIVTGKVGPNMFDKLELEFIKPNKKSVKVHIHDIDPKQAFYDEDLFIN